LSAVRGASPGEEVDFWGKHMSTTKHVLGTSNFLQTWSNTGLITANDDWSGVPSIVGYLGQNITTGVGVNPQTLTTDSALTNDVDVIANQTNPNTNTSGGVAEFEITDPVVALQGSATADAPHLIVYLDATGRENIVFSFRARDIDGSNDNAVQQVAVQYRVGGSGAWIDIPAGYIADATTGPGTLGADIIKTVTLPAGANGASDLQIRVITTNAPAGAAPATNGDEWVGIDDITVTSDAIPPGPGILSVGDAAVAEGNGPGTTPITFTVNRTSGDDGAVTVDYAVTFTGIAAAGASDFVAGQVFTGTLSWADGDATPKTITLLVQGDTTVEPNETFTVTLTNATGGASISDGTAAGQITNDDTGPVAIYSIQGSGHTSPFVGATVTTNGIVTAVDSNGFYIQDASGDGNDATSDGLFVFTSTAPTVAIGDSVTVSGTVTEFQANAASLTVTEITSPTVSVNSTGNVLPAATLIGTGGRTPPTENYEDDNFATFDPATDALDFYESMEGMRVTIQAPLVVAGTNDFGETYVVASEGAGATGINDRKGITVSEGDFNPERIQIDNDPNLSPGYNPDHSQGDLLADVTGILNYAFSSYEVLVTGPVTTATDVALPQETTALDGDSTRLTIASYNVENLDPTDPQSKFDAIASQIVNNLSAPDIVGLQEIQDADGPGTGSNLSGQATADKLIAAIVAAGGPTYQYVEIAPTTANSTGGEPNGNIRNGFLYNPERVTYVAGSAEIVPGAAASGGRYPLAADFTFNGETVTVINVHFTSRGGSDPLMGDNQPPANGGDSARLAQAQAVRAYIDGLAAGDPELNIVTLGDFNSFYFEAPLQAIQAGGAQNNLHLLLPEEERYTYMFEGNLQALDNILVGPNLNLTSQFDVVHVNAEQPEGTARPTDHDPTLALLLISANDLISATAGDDVRRSGAGNDIFYLNQGGNDTASGGAGKDAFYFGATFTAADSVDGGEDVDVLILQGNYSAGVTFGTGTTSNITSIESISLFPGNLATYGDTSNASYSYNLTMLDGNVAAGAALKVNGSGLRAGENFTFDGSAETDGQYLVYGGRGTDTLKGGALSDSFVFNFERFNAGDSVNGGGGYDVVYLRGDYSIDFNAVGFAGSLVNVESVGLLSFADTNYAGGGDGEFDYSIVWNNAMLATGQTITFNGSRLGTEEEMVFNGSAESDGGKFRLFGGGGNDVLTGGSGDDLIVGGRRGDTVTGGAGNDVFRYDSVLDSNLTEADGIQDFNLGDLIDLSRIDANTLIDGDQAFTFVGEATTFSGAAGELRFENYSEGGPVWRVSGDVDGDKVSDFVLIVVINPPDPITSSDFIL
jgi:predicted extracellular nuclease